MTEEFVRETLSSLNEGLLDRRGGAGKQESRSKVGKFGCCSSRRAGDQLDSKTHQQAPPRVSGQEKDAGCG